MNTEKILRNCKATFLSQSQTTVYFKLAFSDLHVWDMPVAAWELLPTA